MEIYFLHPKFNVLGGAEQVLLILCKELSLKGHVVKLITEEKYLDSKINIPVPLIKLRTRNIIALGSKKFKSRVFGQVISNYLTEGSILCAQNFPSYWWMYEATRSYEKRINTVLFCHEPSRSWYFHKTDKELINFTKKDPKCINPNLLKHVRKRLKKINNKKTKKNREFDRKIVESIKLLISNSGLTSQNIISVWGIKSKICHPSTIYDVRNDCQNFTKREGIVFFVTKILTKNIFGVLDTISILVKQTTFNQPIHIIGNIQTPKILSYIKKNQLNDFITVHGFVSDNKKNQILQSVRMCIYIPFDEPFGLVPIESLSCGTPVVVSNLGGFTEVIKNGKTGIYVNPLNPQEVAEVISTYYGDIPKLNAMSKAGLELVQNNHLVKHFVDTFESYLEEVVSN